MITFNNGKTYETIVILSGKKLYDGTYRNYLEIKFASEVTTFEELRALLSNIAALSEITVTDVNPDGVIVGQYIHRNYTIGKSVSCKNENDEMIFVIEVAQKTDSEVSIETILAQLSATVSSE